MPAVLLATFAALLLLEFSGARGGSDSALRDRYRDAQDGGADMPGVVLVAADSGTEQAWGPGPWPPERSRDVLRALTAAAPAAIAWVDARNLAITPSAVSSGEGTEDLREALASGQITVVSFGPETAIDPSGSPSMRALLDSLALGGDGPLPEPPLAGAVPAVGAHRVAAGEIPTQTFAGRVVVFGATAPGLARVVATDSGPTPAAVFAARTIAAAQRGGGVVRLSRWLVGLIAVGFGLLGAWAVDKVSRKAAPLMMLGLGALVVAADAAVFLRWHWYVGATAPVVALIVCVGWSWNAALRHNAEALQATRRAMIGDAGEGRAAGVHEPAWWQSLADRGHELARGAAVSIVTERLPGYWHLQTRAFVQMGDRTLVERRRDVRRPPFRDAYMTLRASRTERTLVDGDDLWTLVVPLSSRGELNGIWLVLFPHSVELTEEQRVEIESVGAELGQSIGRARRDSPLERGQAHRDDDASEHLRAIESSLRLNREELHNAANTIEHLPVGLIVATALGEVLLTNQRMRNLMAGSAAGAQALDDVRHLLANTERTDTRGAADALRSVVVEGTEIHCTVATGDDGATSAVNLHVARLGRGDAPGPALVLVTEVLAQPAANEGG